MSKDFLDVWNGIMRSVGKQIDKQGLSVEVGGYKFEKKAKKKKKKAKKSKHLEELDTLLGGVINNGTEEEGKENEGQTGEVRDGIREGHEWEASEERG